MFPQHPAPQVDVKALKETLWAKLQAARFRAPDRQGPISFGDVISALPANSAAGHISDLSVHLCFICMLHLANENGLAVQGAPDLATLNIWGPGQQAPGTQRHAEDA